MEEQALASSSSTALRWLTPPLLCVPYREAWPGPPGVEARLKRRLDFVERAAQALVAVFAAENRALGLHAPGALARLVGKLDRPSMGDWCAAAVALATQLVDSGQLVAPELARAFARAGGPGEATPTEAALALRRLVEGRNAFSHGRADYPTLAADLAPSFTLFLGALAGFSRRPVLVVRGLRGAGARREAEVLRFRGPEREAETLTLPDVDALMPTGLPLWVADDGRVRVLAPWLAYRVIDGLPALRLLVRMDRGSARWAAEHIGPELREDSVPDAASLRDPVDAETARFTAAQATLLNCRAAAADPERVGPFEILRKLGSGGSGRLYMARRSDETRDVALKLLHADLLADSGAKARLERECAILRGLDRPDLVRVYDTGHDPVHGVWIAMELVEGSDLSRLCPLPAEQSIAIVDDLLHALQALHDRGVVHRDIKPSNVLLRASGRAVLIDLGIAAGAGPRLTRTGDAVGTERYAAPEQLRGGPVDDRADLYAVGRLLSTLVAGEPDAIDLASRLPPGVLAVIARATRPELELRYDSAEAMREALRLAARQGMEGCPVGPGQPIGPVRVVDTIGELRPGIWAFTAKNRVSGAPAGLLVALPGGAAGALVAAHGQFPALHLSVDWGGLHVLVVEAGEERAWIDRLFPLTPEPEPKPPAAAPEPPAAAPVGWKAAAAVLGGLALTGLSLAASSKKSAEKPGSGVRGPSLRAPYMRGMPGPLRTDDPRVLLAMLHQLGLILHAQAGATGEIALTPEIWIKLESQPLVAVARVLHSPPSGAGPVASAMALVSNRPVQRQHLQAFAAALASNGKRSAAELLAIQQLARALGDAIVQVGPAAPLSKLAPYLREADGAWQILVTRGGKPVYVLLKPAFAFP